ncbi:HET-domain-containing protein, partial [Periconia macrospinosa]
MKLWLQHCITNHESCRRSLDDVGPTRLLDLNAFSSDQDIRLVHVENIGKQAYATLSYSWGESVCVKLKTNTHKAFSSRIVLKSLPRTVQDAVKVCRHLSIQYLWVDALCIIQEDGEDFAREISNMGSIYAGSLVTVAAGDSTDCESGLFRRRSPLYQEECVLIHGDEAITFCRERRPAQPFTHHPEICVCKLSKRGWVYQERMMSPRTIYFTRNEVVWECRERACCHNCTLEVPQTTPSNDGLDLKKTFITLHQDLRSHRPEVDILKIWCDILGGYTHVLFSNADDRLSALAGISQLVYKKYQYQASYGIWMETILDGLLWYVKCNGPGWGNAEVLDLAPSWSWVSNREAV